MGNSGCFFVFELRFVISSIKNDGNHENQILVQCKQIENSSIYIYINNGIRYLKKISTGPSKEGVEQRSVINGQI